MADTVSHRVKVRMPKRYFWISFGYLCALLLGAGATAIFPASRDWLPARFGPIPAPVPWWGALGAVTASLYGVFFHSEDWDPSFDYWHFSRPLLGAVMGSVGYLIFVVAIAAAGNPSPDPEKSNLTYLLVAFLVGYREETFHRLIAMAVDTVLAPGKPVRPGAGNTGDRAKGGLGEGDAGRAVETDSPGGVSGPGKQV